VGRPACDIDTPALVVDIDAMQRNLGRMAEFARKHDIRWRPHAKMHKSSAIARLQVQAGAVGVCVQKTSEAEAMVAGGVHDVYISNEVSTRPSSRAWRNSRTRWRPRTASSPLRWTASKACGAWPMP